MNVSLNPVFPAKERDLEEREEARKPIDSKVRGLVLKRIRDNKSALLHSHGAPRIQFSSSELGKIKATRKKKQTLKKSPHRKIPIGLMPVDQEGKLNALMQLILYVPGFTDSFSLVPKSFSPILTFIDQVHRDHADNYAVSSADGSLLFSFFESKFLGFSLEKIFDALVELVKPKWTFFHETVESEKTISVPDLFLSGNSLKKQIFVEPNQVFDLDAFIEKRPDVGEFHYFTYVKVDGCWYQCDNERITQLRSDMLNLPLQRGVLAHYRKVF